MRSITVEKLLRDNRQDLGLRIYAGRAGKDRKIETPRIQKSALLFAGIFRAFHPDRIQVASEAERLFFGSLVEEKKKAVIEKLISSHVPCLIFADGVKPPPELRRAASEKAFPVLVTEMDVSTVIEKLMSYLSLELADRTSVHGVFLDVYGVGVLITGESGIGKSECALDLITKGHRFVADDVIEIEKRGKKVLLGKGADVIKHYMEIRGLGIINIRDLFGLSSIVDSKAIDLIVEFEYWDSSKEYDRIGLEAEEREILGVKVPAIRIPVSPARNLSTLVEVAVRNHILKQSGINSAEKFLKRHRKVLLSDKKEEREDGSR